MNLSLPALPDLRSVRTPKIRWRWLAAAALIGVALVWFAPEDETVVTPLARKARASVPSANAGSSLLTSIRFPARKETKLAADLFAVHSWYRPPPPVYVKPAPPPPPTAPPFPYSYLGQYARTGDKTVYILQRGDSVFDVRVGDVLDGVWKLEAIVGGQIQLTYVPLQLKQMFSVGSEQ
jgi:hypothetical protein